MSRSLIKNLIFSVIFLPQFGVALAFNTTTEEKACIELGFKPKTEKYGKCVLELIGRNGGAARAPKESEPNKIQQRQKIQKSEIELPPQNLDVNSCQTSRDCKTGYSCRSKPSGGTECRNASGARQPTILDNENKFNQEKTRDLEQTQQSEQTRQAEIENSRKWEEYRQQQQRDAEERRFQRTHEEEARQEKIRQQEQERIEAARKKWDARCSFEKRNAHSQWIEAKKNSCDGLSRRGMQVLCGLGILSGADDYAQSAYDSCMSGFPY